MSWSNNGPLNFISLNLSSLNGTDTNYKNDPNYIDAKKIILAFLESNKKYKLIDDENIVLLLNQIAE